jgi:hypothetical protein
MKNDKTANSGEKKSRTTIPAGSSKKDKTGQAGYTISSPVRKTKARAGDSLANEGTNVSYDEER